MSNLQPGAATESGELIRKRRELADLKRRAEALEAELAAAAPSPSGRFGGYYTAYYATTGFLLGMFGAATSLLFNIVGSLLAFGEGDGHPLKLIQVYLTFPLGERALRLESGLALAVGCCLYLATGMLLGMLFQLFFTRYLPEASFTRRLTAASLLSLVVWIVNFYGILSWLQPLLFDGRWIVDLIPPWVAAATHLVFGWTMAVVYPWGLYVPYRTASEQE